MTKTLLQIDKLDFLIALYILCVVLSELMGLKTFYITNLGSFPLNASVAIFTIPVVFVIEDIINEVYGRERTRSIVRSALFMVFLVFVFTILATSLPPSARFSKSEPTYDAIFTVSTRIAAASLLAFAVSQFADLVIFSKIREKMRGKALWLRTNASNFISVFLDSFVFIFLAFYAMDKSFSDNFPFLMGLIIPYYLLKCLMSVIETPFVYAGVKWLKR
jgi:queuosine precursor transporter